MNVNPSAMNTTPDLFRIDKNIAHNIDYISKSSNDKNIVNSDGNLIKNLIYYFCYSYQNNLFNFGAFDVYDFASKFGYSPKYLSKRHPAPEQFKNKADNEINALYERQEDDINYKIYDSVIENALFILHTKPIVFIRGAKTVDYSNKEITYSTDSNSYLVINQLTTQKISRLTKEHGGHRKLHGHAGDKNIYSYTLDKLFIENLSHYYLKGARESLLHLRKSSLDDLYLYLLNLKNNLQVKGQNQTTLSETINFELLCDLAHIKSIKESGEPYENKYRKRDLIRALREIHNKSELKFDLQWTKRPNDKFYFIPIFIFEKPQKIDPIKERDAIFKSRLGHELIDSFRVLNKASYYSDKRDERFIEWLRDTNLHVKEKILAYENANFRTYGKISPYIDSMKENFIKKCATVTSLKEL